jgi:hypothetical protein
LNRLFSFVSLSISLSCVAWSLAACGGGDGTIDSCVSSYTGTFTGTSDDGPSTGRILAVVRGVYVNERGDEAGPLIEYTFVFDSKPDAMGNVPSSSSSQTLMPDGSLVESGSGLRLTGRVDLDSCEGSGSWQGNAFQGSGEWTIALPDTAF